MKDVSYDRDENRNDPDYHDASSVRAPGGIGLCSVFDADGKEIKDVHWLNLRTGVAETTRRDGDGNILRVGDHCDTQTRKHTAPLELRKIK